MRWAALSAGVVFLLAACASPVPLEPTRSPVAASGPPTAVATPVVLVQTVPPAGPPIPAAAVRVLASPSPVGLPLSVLAGRSGADVRVTIDRLLQEQVFLSTLGMDAASNSRLDELFGVSDALDQNSVALAEVLGTIKGQSTAESFLGAWRGQNADLIQYAQGQSSAASNDLGRRDSAIAAQLAMGDLSAAAVEDLVRTRNQAQLALADASISHDSVDSSRRLRLAAMASDDLGRPLAAAIAVQAPQLAPPPTEGADIDMRLSINRYLVEHVYLTGAAVEAAADGRPGDLHARVDAARASADELGQQLGGVWGADLGSGVAERLKAETAALVSLASGGDRATVATDLDRLRAELDGLLAGANPLLPKGMLSQQLRPSDQPLLLATDAFAARDFGTAYARLREAASRVQKPADALSLSIIDRFPGRYLVLPTATPAGPG